MIRVVAAFLLVAVGAAALAAPAGGDVTTIRLRLHRGRLDYFMPPPSSRTVVFAVDARDAAAKSRIMFTAPLPAGHHWYRIHLAHGDGHSLTVATPVQAGQSVFDVTFSGAGRVDLGFWSAGDKGREYRFTFTAPVEQTPIAVDLR